MTPNTEALPTWLCGGASVGKLAQYSKPLGFPMRAKVNTVFWHTLSSLWLHSREWTREHSFPSAWLISGDSANDGFEFGFRIWCIAIQTREEHCYLVYRIFSVNLSFRHQHSIITYLISMQMQSPTDELHRLTKGQLIQHIQQLNLSYSEFTHQSQQVEELLQQQLDTCMQKLKTMDDLSLSPTYSTQQHSSRILELLLTGASCVSYTAAAHKHDVSSSWGWLCSDHRIIMDKWV